MFAKIACGVLLAVMTGPLAAEDETAKETTGGRFLFAWPFADDDVMRPRGGTSTGPSVDLLAEPTEAFQRLGDKGISDFQRDRRAILAMAGPYRVSFDFLEIMGYSADYEPVRPYQSWGTEYVYVIANEPERISLQHLLVTRVIDDGKTLGPFVVKHWRQDWRYEAPSAHTYRGANTWRRKTILPGQREGHWLQTVWQVDDSPRYAAWGRWRHHREYSTWLSGETWRPLPRREFAVRDDYDLLIGSNRHTVLPTGWVQEERNHKVVTDGPGEVARRVAKEYGVARYERIQYYDFSPGDDYWQATADFWALVREHWHRLLAANEVIHLKAQADQAQLFRPLFERAQAIADGEDYDPEAANRFIRKTIDGYLAKAPRRDGGY